MLEVKEDDGLGDLRKTPRRSSGCGVYPRVD